MLFPFEIQEGIAWYCQTRKIFPVVKLIAVYYPSNLTFV